VAKKNSRGELVRAGQLDLLQELAREPVTAPKPTAMQERLISMPTQDQEDISILYQHSVLCQTCMPYRDPGDEQRDWQRSNGFVSLLIQAGKAYDAAGDSWLDIGLPYGPKPRLECFITSTLRHCARNPPARNGG
jgi:hypothetical protein